MRRVSVLSLLAVVLVACGSNTVTTTTGAAGHDPAAAAVCADMDRPLSDSETFPFEASQDTGPHQIGKFGAADVPYWQRIQKDGPPSLVAAVSTLIAATQRGLALTEAQQNGPEADAILDDPTYVAAKQTVDDYIAANCPEQAPTPTSAPFAPAPADAAFCADLAARIPNDVNDRLEAEGKSNDPTVQARSFFDFMNAQLALVEQAERDAPPELAADMATIVDATRRMSQIDPSLSRQAVAKESEAIMSEPAHKAAIKAESEFQLSRCDGIDKQGN